MVQREREASNMIKEEYAVWVDIHRAGSGFLHVKNTVKELVTSRQRRD